MKLYQLGKGVSKYYRSHVKNNAQDNDRTVQRKLTRNILLAKKVEPAQEGKELYFYGNLQILVVGNKIVWLKNGDKCHSKIDEDKKILFNSVLGIV